MSAWVRLKVVSPTTALQAKSAPEGGQMLGCGPAIVVAPGRYIRGRWSNYNI